VVSSRIQSVDIRTLTNDVYIKNDLILQKRLTAMFLEEARKRLPVPFTTDELQNFANEEKHGLDAFYVAFEDQFRGSHEAIYERLKVYIPVLEAANVDLKVQILDIGCGRGEWLQLLHDFGYKAKGIDLNRIMVEQCRIRGLEAIEADVIDYLQSLPDESLSCVTGFHIIEHLSFEILIKLFDEIVRVLIPSGVLIFETPNARNILVGSGDFYRDPTHKNPIHPDTISFIARSRGLINSESYFFEKIDGVLSLVSSSIKQFNDLSEYVSVSRDTALIAHKASK
jgi:2-polyprenyl-3-methyl-5-hydroxy-6-metoxy-1,4-benzoquinol methylase